MKSCKFFRIWKRFDKEREKQWEKKNWEKLDFVLYQIVLYSPFTIDTRKDWCFAQFSIGMAG